LNNDGFIFLLTLGSTLLAGVVAVAHISSYRLAKRRSARQQAAAAKEPEFEFAPGSDVLGTGRGITVRNLGVGIQAVDHAKV
jgi:hypothetical protein